VSLIYDSTASRWRAVTSSIGIALPEQFHYFDDMHGTHLTTSGMLIGVVSGTGASIQTGTYLVNTTEKPYGIMQADTGTTATGRAYITTTGAANIIPTLGPALFLTRLAVEALSNGTERYQIRAGWHDASGGTDVTDGVYWEYDDATSGDWRTAASGTSTRTKNTVTGLTADTNYIWLGIFCNAAWTEATFFSSTNSTSWSIFGTKIADANMPTSTELLQASVGINKTVGTTQRNLSIDCIGFRYDFARG
jgi:hypothetical protein